MTDKTAGKPAEPSVEFSGLILGFCSAALSYMGFSPEGQKLTDMNLTLAKQNIDIIELLRDKTRGNLTADESELISQALTDLKLRYVEACKAAKISK